MADRALSVTAFARAVHMTSRHVRRLIKAGLPIVGGGSLPRIRLEAGKAWIEAARRARTDGPATEARTALLDVQAHGTRSKERRHRALYVHETAWAPAWRAHLDQVRAVLAEWQETAPARILEILQPGGRRLFPGQDARAIGYAVVEYVVRPLLEQLATRVEAQPAAARSPAPSVRGAAARTVPAAKTRLVEARTSELAIRTAIKTDPAWRLRTTVDRALVDALAAAKSELLTALPGRCVRLRGGGPLQLPAVAAVVATCARDMIAALERPLSPIAAAPAPAQEA